MPTASGHTRLILAEKVQGTDVYNQAGEHIGTVEDVVLDKLSGNVVFAVMSFGGFLGIGERYHPRCRGRCSTTTRIAAAIQCRSTGRCSSRPPPTTSTN